jgi:SAM-dependent methyltransferase
LDRWLEALEARHLADLTFSEVVRALRALSSRYVERRTRLESALDSRGKRAAFALFYGPQHFLLVREIVRMLDATCVRRIADLGCGTGVGGAAWALAAPRPAAVVGIDRHPWAVAEAVWTYRVLGVRGRARRGELIDGRPPPGAAILASFAINELPADRRKIALGRLTKAVAAGHPLLLVEPMARGVVPWWSEWVDAFQGLGGRADQWRMPIELPELLVRLDRAAGLDHRVLTARTIWVPAGPNGLRDGS